MRQKIRVFNKGRFCKFYGCRQLLNIYNPANYCYTHQRVEADKLIYKHRAAYSAEYFFAER